MLVGIIDLNGRKGRRQAEVALQTGPEEVADIVVIAEALEDQQRRPTHPTYDRTRNSKYMSVYLRKDKDIKVVRKDAGEWAMIGGNTAVAYLRRHKNFVQVEQALPRMASAETVMGDYIFIFIFLHINYSYAAAT